MIIGNDLLTKIMLTNTLSRNEKLRSQLSETTQFSTLFSNVLNQLVSQQGSQPAGQVNLNLLPTNVEVGNKISFSANPYGTNGNWSILEHTINQSSITADKFDQVLHGKLAGKGQAFIAASQEYNIDPALLVAIAQHETGNGKSRAAMEKNNIAGMMGRNGLKAYATVEESIRDMARNLSENYLGKGLNTIAKIGAKYAPIGATNDPTGLNNHWVNGVNKYYNRLNIG